MRSTLALQLQQTIRRSSPAPPSHLIQQLLTLSIPLIPSYGFSSQTLSAASLLLPAPHTPSQPTGFSSSTIDALFPSPPPRNPSASNGKGGSLTRDEIIAEAMGGSRGDARQEKERIGPAKALVEAWLEEGRKVMVTRVKELGWKGDKGVREGLRERIRWNESVSDMLPEALALLGTSTTSPLSRLSPSSLFPIPSPFGVLEHIAEVAHDLARATGDESQGVGWYATRARIGTIYGLAELQSLSPDLTTLTPEARTESSLAFLDRLLEGDQKLAGVQDYGNFVIKSWAGMGRSLGVGI